jgi:Fe-S-cluster containining protein
VRLFVSPEQRFTCAQCGRCCHRTTVPITADEAAALRAAGAAEWFDEDPFELIPGHAPLLRIRKRDDGACVFLTAEGRCRIHEVIGEQSKPLACRIFPFSFHTIRTAAAAGHSEDEIVVSASFACPTVIANEGAAATAQRAELQKLQTAWNRVFPAPAAPIEFVRGRTIPRDALSRIRTFLMLLLDRPGALHVNVRRIAALIEDWTRPRVLELDPDAFVEYLELTGNYALAIEAAPPVRPPARVTRLLFRGFLFAILALQVRLDAKRGRAGTTLTLARLLAHLHGVGPAVGDYDLGRAMRLPLPLEDPAVRAIVHRHLRSAFETLGATRRPVADEIAMRAAYLNAASVVGAMHAVAAGKSSVDAESLTKGLLASGDMSQADAGGRISSLLTTLAGGVEALYLFPALRRS